MIAKEENVINLAVAACIKRVSILDDNYKYERDSYLCITANGVLFDVSFSCVKMTNVMTIYIFYNDNGRFLLKHSVSL